MPFPAWVGSVRGSQGLIHDAPATPEACAALSRPRASTLNYRRQAQLHIIVHHSPLTSMTRLVKRPLNLSGRPSQKAWGHKRVVEQG